MAFSSITRNANSIFPLLIILLITPFSSSFSSFSPNDKVTKQLINNLCSQPTLYKHFCVSWLNSDQTIFTSNLHGLVVKIFQKTSSLGHKNLEMMKGLVRTTTDPELKIPYESCVKDYESSVLAIDGAIGFTKNENYVLATKAAFKAFDSISNCEALLEGLKMPGYVYNRNLMFERMCNIDKIFSDILTF